MNRKFAPKVLLMFLLAMALAVPFLTSTRNAGAFAPVPGAIFTTNAACNGVDLNIYTSKADVYVDGGPAHPNAAGLPDGSYYVQVTDPSGATVLGKSLSAVAQVVNGKFVQCYQLADIVYSASSSYAAKGYDDTPNAGGEYKVWVSQDSAFANDASKTDNFKVKSSDCTGDCGPQEVATLVVIKFYDANANGINDDNQNISGWKVCVQQAAGILDCNHMTPLTMSVAPDTYTVSEETPVEGNWLHTTPTSDTFAVADGQVHTTEFGNVCLGPGGGLTLGFWSNKNGGKVITNQNLLSSVLALCLRNANGNSLGSVNLAQFQQFLLQANATNMANMLSAQLAAMKLNVLSGGVNGNALIYAPGTNSANSLGFATVNAVMTEANTLLCAGGASSLVILSGNPLRARAEALKNALDKGNNNLNFVQASPCPFSF